MSDIHILTGDEKGNYTAVVHFAVPLGNNSAGIPWKDALVSDGRNTSVMIEPAITPEELSSIIAGDVLESVITLRRMESGGGTVRVRPFGLDTWAAPAVNPT